MVMRVWCIVRARTRVISRYFRYHVACVRLNLWPNHMVAEGQGMHLEWMIGWMPWYGPGEVCKFHLLAQLWHECKHL